MYLCTSITPFSFSPTTSYGELTTQITIYTKPNNYVLRHFHLHVYMKYIHTDLDRPILRRGYAVPRWLWPLLRGNGQTQMYKALVETLGQLPDDTVCLRLYWEGQDVGIGSVLQALYVKQIRGRYLSLELLT